MPTPEAPTPRDVALSAADGHPLRAWLWPHPHPHAVMVVAHGFGEHGGRYGHLAEALGPALGLEILAFDFRGHGRSPGRRGVVRRYTDLSADLRAALSWTSRTRPGLPQFVLGHSNGGQVALQMVLDGQAAMAGMIVSNPVLRLATRVPRHKLWIGSVLRRYAPGVTLKSEIDPQRLTSDPVMQAAFGLDVLRHDRISPPLFFGMVEGGALITARASEIQTPILMILGGADPIVDPEESRAFFNRLGSLDKTLLLYPHMLHEPLNELRRAEVIADVAAWLAARIGPSSPEERSGDIVEWH